MARDYELGIVITPEAGDEQARAIVERVTQTVGTQGGQVVRVDAWGRRHLAYPIERHRDGLYFWFDLILPPTGVAEIERSLRVNESVIRHLITLRDPRVVTQKRQREAEQDQQAAIRAADQAARAEQAAQAAQAAQEAQAQSAATAPTGATDAAGEPSEPGAAGEGAPLEAKELASEVSASAPDAAPAAEQANPDDTTTEGE